MTGFRFKNPEDEKLAVLANATLRRSGAPQAAALRDLTGRTYAGISIAAGAFILDAAESVFTIALASQIEGIESVVVVGSSAFNIDPLREFAPTCKINLIAEDGEITSL